MTPTAATAKIVTCATCGKRNRVPASGPTAPRCGNCHSPVPWLADAGDGDFTEVADQAPIPVLVDLWAPWCGPCRMVSPALEHLAQEKAGVVKLVKVNVDEAQQVAQRFAVQGIPTLVVMDRGSVLATQTGAAPEAVLRQWLDDTLRARDRPAHA
jgi:thioredoxin 2